MVRGSREGLASGLAVGVSVGFVAAVAMRFIPSPWLAEPLGRAALYVAALPVALLFVPIATTVARRRRESPRLVLLWACSAALALDGLLLGFAPALYGHEGRALTSVATLLLWAFAWIVVAALLVARESAASEARDGRGRA